MCHHPKWERISYEEQKRHPFFIAEQLRYMERCAVCRELRYIQPKHTERAKHNEADPKAP